MARNAARARGYITGATFPVRPSISGTPKVGQTLTGADGTIAGATFSARRWMAGTTQLATTQTYIPVSGDVGKLIHFTAVAARPDGTKVTVRSPAVGPIVA